MNQTINILDRTWIRGHKKLQGLQMTLSSNNQTVTLEISSRSQIKDLVRINFYTLAKAIQRKLRHDFVQELKFNKKQYRHAVKINKKVKNIKMKNKELLN